MKKERRKYRQDGGNTMIKEKQDVERAKEVKEVHDKEQKSMEMK
jgi:hypothetical protein